MNAADARTGGTLRVLIVEDEVFIALELECLLEEAGHVAAGMAGNSTEAIALGLSLRPDVALVDIHLTDGPTGVEVARALCAQGGTTVLFMTANAKRIPDDVAGVLGVVAKPYSARTVHAALDYVARSRDGVAPARAPEGMRLLAGALPRGGMFR